MKIDLLFERYLENVKATTSIENYIFNYQNVKVMKIFFHEQQISNTRDISTASIYRLIDFLKNRKNCTSSINKKIGTMKRALKFSSIYIDGVSNFKKIKSQSVRYEIVSRRDLSKALRYLNSLDNSPVNITKKLVFNLFLYTGVRAKELLNIEIKNINISLNTILLTQTKSRKSRFVFFHEWLSPLIEEYIRLKDRQFLFHNFRTDSRLNHMHLRTIFHYIEMESGTNRIRPHMLRHTMATLLVENNAPLYSIKELLGHESISTTQIYLHLSTKKLKNDYNTFFPKLKE